eukprot:scaffold31639_cov62-Phaeocystis_antarctica.AAC.1
MARQSRLAATAQLGSGGVTAGGVTRLRSKVPCLGSGSGFGFEYLRRGYEAKPRERLAARHVFDCPEDGALEYGDGGRWRGIVGDGVR